jgi:hypothetical protein
MDIPETIILHYELEEGKRHYRQHHIVTPRARAQFTLSISFTPTPCMLPTYWHRYQLTPHDIQRFQKCDPNLLYQHLTFYLLHHHCSIEKLFDVSRDNRSIFSFRCGNSKPLLTMFMSLYIDYMIKHEPQWPYTQHKIIPHNPLHTPPLPTITATIPMNPPVLPPHLPSPFRQLTITHGTPYMMQFPHLQETIPFFPMIQEDKHRYLMIRLHEQQQPSTPKKTVKPCIVSMPCYIHYQSINTTYVLGYESFLLNVANDA